MVKEEEEAGDNVIAYITVTVCSPFLSPATALKSHSPAASFQPRKRSIISPDRITLPGLTCA